jgi:uncharacterized membrane protein
MNKSRLEAFSDCVISILITIMVLGLAIPRGNNLAALLPMIPTFLSYVLSFMLLGIYWNNHHHLFQATKHVNGQVLWANMHFLFWLSLIPFATAWMGENSFSSYPVALYGTVHFFAGIAYLILTRALINLHGKDSVLAIAIGRDLKGTVSAVILILAIPLAFFQAWLSCAMYVLLAIIWFVPDQRIEKTLSK